MPWILQLAEHLLGIVSGGVFFYLAIVLLSGASRSGFQGLLALIPVLWQTLNMVDRFFGFRQVSTASDQTLEVLFLVSATLFLLSHTRCVAGMPLSRRAGVTRGFLTALLDVYKRQVHPIQTSKKPFPTTDAGKGGYKTIISFVLFPRQAGNPLRLAAPAVFGS